MSLIYESGRPLSLLELRSIAILLILDGHTAKSIVNQFGVTCQTAERWIAKANGEPPPSFLDGIQRQLQIKRALERVQQFERRDDANQAIAGTKEA